MNNQSTNELTNIKNIDKYSFSFNDQIGKGYSSQVYKGKNNFNQSIVAIKVINIMSLPSQFHHNLLSNEIAVLKTLQKSNSPYIMKMLDICQSKNNTYIITEYCNQGDLDSLLKKQSKLELLEAQKILTNIVEGLKELQLHNIVHRDLKPANILLNDGIAKIGDFGFAKFENQIESQQCHVGTPLYMAPEVQNDVWAFTCMLYELIIGHVPFYAQNEQHLILKINAGQIPIPEDLNSQTVDLIKNGLALDLQKRFNIYQISSHPFFQSTRFNFNERRSINNIKPKYLLENSQDKIISIDQKSNTPNSRSLLASRNFDTIKKEEQKDQQDILTKNISFSNQKYLYNPQRKLSEHVLQKAIQIVQLKKESMNELSPLIGHRANTNENSKNKENADLSPIKQDEKMRKLKTESSQKLQLLKQQRIFELAEENFKDNQDVVNSQILFCKFLYKIYNLLENFNMEQIKEKRSVKNLLNLNQLQDNNKYEDSFKKTKLQFLIQKNIAIKIQKLQECMNQKNVYFFQNWHEFCNSLQFKGYQQLIQSQYDIYMNDFKHIFENINQIKHKIKDKKFEAVFDNNLTEFESFYILQCSFIRMSILEIQSWLQMKIEQIDGVQSIKVTYGLMLLQNLVLYYQLIKQNLQIFHKPIEFSHLPLIEEIGKENGNVNQSDFVELKKKIQKLCVNN